MIPFAFLWLGALVFLVIEVRKAPVIPNDPNDKDQPYDN